MIYAVIAVHNRAEMTRQFLQALRDQTVQNIHLILVDDGSTDGTAEMAKTFFPDCTIVRGDGSWWWTLSMQKGIEAVRTMAHSGDFVLCANNDQVAEPNAVEILRATSLRYDRALVGSIAKEFHNRKKLFDSAYTIHWSNFQYTPVPLASTGAYDGPIDVLTCRMTLIPIEVFAKINFDGRRFPHYLGDYDFFLQAKKFGFRLILSYESVIYDLGGISGTDVSLEGITLRQLWANMFRVSSHHNVIFMTRYFLKNCPRFLFKVKFLLLLFHYYAYLHAKALIASFRSLREH